MLCVLLLCVLTVAQSVAGSNVVYKPPILGSGLLEADFEIDIGVWEAY